jgi:hypothetical protein
LPLYLSLSLAVCIIYHSNAENNSIVTVVNLGLTIWALLPNDRDKREWDSDDEEEDEPLGSSGGRKGSAWEMQSIPPTPRTGGFAPFTPRTMAFNTLERKLPLRHQYQ